MHFQKMIDPLPAIDHRDIDYARFNKNFYVEHEEITAMSADKVNELRDKLGIRVSVKTQSVWYVVSVDVLILTLNVVIILISS